MSKGALDEAVNFLKSGSPVVYPTETFYGLGVDPYNEDAVRSVFEVKGREEGKPISLIVKDMEMARELVSDFPPWAMALAEEFWPGPLTMLLKGGRDLLSLLTGREGKVGLRISSNPWAMRLVESFGSPITATSANRSGAASPVAAEDVLAGLGGTVPLILDGGRLRGTKGSTVLDANVFPPVVIREGEIPALLLEKIWKRYISSERVLSAGS